MRRTVFTLLALHSLTFAFSQEFEDPASTNDWNLLWKSSFVESYNASNLPEGGWFLGINMNHSNNIPGYRYNGQIAIRNSYLDPVMYFRSTNIW